VACHYGLCGYLFPCLFICFCTAGLTF
jgi:hypothetical protein